MKHSAMTRMGLRRWLPMRIRGKLIFLHTMFSLALAVALLLALRPPLGQILGEAEGMQARLALELYDAAPGRTAAFSPDEIEIRTGSASELGLDDATAEAARARPGAVVVSEPGATSRAAVRWSEAEREFTGARVRFAPARNAANRLYVLLMLALLAVYGLIALTLEVFVLPRQVYEPIARLRAADESVQRGRREGELIPEELIPADELGEIMRSRNLSILQLRGKEQELGSALEQIELAANELKRKNHLLETARRNLADQDRLASLGMMSAGIAHELNTPLSVLKGCVEEVAEAAAASGGGGISRERASLMLRVVGRLERLGESLLDFARVRPPASERIALREMVDEAWTLVSLDRGAARAVLLNSVADDEVVEGDPARLMQVMVNLLRNAAEAIEDEGNISVEAAPSSREGREWVTLTVMDDGPGIDPPMFACLFEPFASTRLDSHGTGLGLAVAEGIVREHGGLLLARNALPPARGAVFTVMLPRSALGAPLMSAEDAASSSPAVAAPFAQHH